MLNKSYMELRNQAHYQIEAMCAVMLKAAQTEVDTLPYLVQSLAIRIDALNGAMVNAANDATTETIGELRAEVRGPGSYARGDHA